MILQARADVGSVTQTSAHEVPTAQAGNLQKPRAGERTRTADPLFTRQALYQLSYSGKKPEFRGSDGTALAPCAVV